MKDLWESGTTKWFICCLMFLFIIMSFASCEKHIASKKAELDPIAQQIDSCARLSSVTTLVQNCMELINKDI